MKNSSMPIAAAMAAIAALVPSWVWAQASSNYSGYGYGPRMMGWDGGYGMIFGPLFMILVLAVVIGVVVLLVRWLGGSCHGTASPRHAPPGRTSLDILKERFARGEIDKAEFEERRRVLGD